MRIMVIGGTRFIGPAVAERLLGGGHVVTLFHRGQHEDAAPRGARHLHGERAQLTEMATELRRLAPETVIDMAPMTAADAAAVMAAFHGVAGRIVAISSSDVYRAYGRLHGSEPGPLEPTPLTEDSPLREQIYPYRGEGRDLDDYDKIPVEQGVMSDLDLPGTVLRLPAVHGERDYQHRLFMEVARMDAGRPVIPVRSDAMAWRWSRAYAGNVADAIALAATDPRAADRVYNVAEPDALTQAEWTRAVGRAAGWSGEVVAVPPELMPVIAGASDLNHAQHMDVDSSRIRAELGYSERVSRDAGIARAVAWERAHPPRRVDPSWVDFGREDQILRRLGR